MLKKVIVSMLAVSLLGQNMLFAQGTSQEDLRSVQQRAKAASNKIQISTGTEKVLTVVGMTAVIGAAWYFMGGKEMLREAKIQKGKAAFEKYVWDIKNVNPSFHEFIQETRFMTAAEEGEQVTWIEGELARLAQNARYNRKASKNIFSHWAQMQKTKSGAPLFTAEEAWMLEVFSTHNDVLSINPKELIPALKDLALHNTPAAKSFARVLIKRGGVALGLVFVFAATAQASSDGKMVQRIMNNPKLFMEADEAGLQEIAQNPDADTFVRAYTKGLETLAALPQAEREAILNESAKAEQEARRQVSTLRPVKAR